MAYPPPAQRPPPLRQYASSPAPSASAHDGMYGGGYADGYGDGSHDYPDGGHDDPGYHYQSSSAGPQPYGSSRSHPRAMRPPGPPSSSGRPPHGYDGRRGYPGDRPPPQKRSRTPGARPPPGETFDNPFPAMGPRDPRDRRRPPPGALEKGMAGMDINGRPPPRPHTSNGRRPDMRPPPMRGPPPGRGRGGYPRALGDLDGRRPPIYASHAGHPEADHPSGPFEGPPRPNTAGGMRPPPRTRPVNDIDPGLMIPPPDPVNRVSYAPKDFLDTYYDSGDEHEMPNFDAMPHTNGPVDEMALDAPKTKAQTPSSPAPSTGPYAAYTPGSAPTPGSRSGDAPNQFENAGFQFDIPGEAPSPAARHPNHPGYSYEQPNGFRSNGASPYPVNDQTEGDNSQNPDALPHHPVPFRPGHDQGAKPAPVRQYNGTPAPASAPAAPQPVSLGPTRAPPITQDQLQQIQQKARNNPSDQKLQLLLAKKLVEASKVLVADNSRLDPKTKAKTKEKYIADAHKIVKKLVSAGSSEAQFYMADCYGEGQLGLPVDPKEAFSLYQSAAKQGHAQSAYRVAVCCEIGQEEGGGTKRDPLKAVQWYKRAAALGDTPAMYKMGMISLKGLLGQALSPREGVSWLKRAAERADVENPHALHELALMYQNASGNDVVIRDEQYASQLFHQAADLGYKFSQFRLGTAYEYGLMGCPADNRMSIIWYTRAAAQGEHQSELALSGWYLTGSEGILQQNDTEAYLWARKAATAGLAKAEYAMGYFTEVGIGVTANLDDAKRWYWRAAAQGFPKARERLEDLKKGGQRMQKTRLSRSAVKKQSDGDCVVM
ncbi:hypothetical protein N7492_003326 [Penicillium capsulatum]|uniref:Chitin synthase activator n=1 Tax=Penicillium capsulatum TaxID=69766 RepID=A0A9W9LW03_9EURO|nr:hypothetical protein N7492_003326 [Penicillium capsulatum]